MKAWMASGRGWALALGTVTLAVGCGNAADAFGSCGQIVCGGAGGVGAGGSAGGSGRGGGGEGGGQPFCPVDHWQCVGNVLHACASGLPEQVVNCGSDAYCMGTGCEPRLCAEKQTACVGDVYSVCSTLGDTYSPSRDCSAEGLRCTPAGCAGFDAGLTDGGLGDGGLGDGGSAEPEGNADASVDADAG